MLERHRSRRPGGAGRPRAHPGSSLADRFDPNTQPFDLRRAHKALDRAVDAAYQSNGGQRAWSDDAERMAFLFQLYAALTSLLA